MSGWRLLYREKSMVQEAERLICAHSVAEYRPQCNATRCAFLKICLYLHVIYKTMFGRYYEQLVFPSLFTISKNIYLYLLLHTHTHHENLLWVVERHSGRCRKSLNWSTGWEWTHQKCKVKEKSLPECTENTKPPCLSPTSYLAGILVHAEAGHVVLGHFLPHLANDVLGQLGGQEGFSGAAGSWEDDATMLHQQVEVPLDDGLWNQRVEHQAVYTVLLHT